MIMLNSLLCSGAQATVALSSCNIITCLFIILNDRSLSGEYITIFVFSELHLTGEIHVFTFKN